MFPSAYHDLSRPNMMNIIESIKSSDGKSVSELADELNLSYMGAKQNCVKLEKMGYLKTWRVPRKEAGRPEKLYQLTPKCDVFFPKAGVNLTLSVLESVRKLYGETAPEKMLFLHFEELGLRWKTSIVKGKSLVEKATRLVELRQREGCFCRCQYSAETGFVIEEYHHPMQEIFAKYPSAQNLDIKLMEKLLGSTVKRLVKKCDRGTSVVMYDIGTL